MSGIYLHIPFCRQACSYCDFFFVTRTEYRQQFVEQLTEEIKRYRNTAFAEEPVDTVYFGGGTPSLLNLSEVEKIMTALKAVFDFQPEEITFEMNPDDVNREYLEGLHGLGITRSSMGVQSFKPELLRFMNRAHNRDEALECLELLHLSEFRTFTVDLIYANPGQTLQDLEQDLQTLTAFEPPHVSAYSLTIESGTRLGKMVEQGRIRPPDEEREAGHFDLVMEKLGEAGIRQYEISNYSLPGHEAVHNSNYWRHNNYLGFGPSGHSFWWGDKAKRWKNKSDLKSYIEGDAGNLREEQEVLSCLQLAEERLMMGLRTRSGVSFRELEERYGYTLNEQQRSYLKQKEEEEKVKTDEHSFRFTRKGLKIADTLILDIITAGS